MGNYRKRKAKAAPAKHRHALAPLDDAQLNVVMRHVFAWMWVGMGVTATVASIISVGAFMPSLASLVFIIIAQFTVALILDRKLRRFSPKQAGIFLVAYAALTGVTLSLIFAALYYPQVSVTVVNACFSAALLFGLMTFVGWRTRLDFSHGRSYVWMFLLGLLIAFLVDKLMPGEFFDQFFSYFSVLLFSSLAASQRGACAALATAPDMPVKPADSLRFSLLAALQLYLGAAKLFLLALASLFWRRSSADHYYHHVPHYYRSHYHGMGSGGVGGGSAGGIGGGGGAGGGGSIGGGGGSFTP